MATAGSNSHMLTVALGMLLINLIASCMPAYVGFSSASQMLRKSDTAPPQAGSLAEQRTQLLSEPESVDSSQIARAALAMAAALVVAFVPLAEAHAAKTGGRIGGTAPSVKPKPPPSRAAPVKERVVEKTTIIQQQAAPVMMAPAPSLGNMVMGAAVQGVVGGAVSGAVQSAMALQHSGPSGSDRMLENQMRQDERQMDKQANDIEDLKRQLAEIKK